MSAIETVPTGAARARAPQRNPGWIFKSLQAIAVVGCGILALMSMAAMFNWVFGAVPTPKVFRSWFGVAHFVAMFCALPLTVAQFVLPKGTGLHRKVGYAWCVALLSASLFSFGMNQLGTFSVPRAFAIATLFLVPLIVFLARTGRRRAHRNLVLGFVLIEMVIAGAFAFKGDRALSQLFWSIWS